MKKLLIIILSIGIAASASAQKVSHGWSGRGHGGYYRPHTTVVVGAYAPFAPWYGYYSPWYGYAPLYGYNYPNYRPTKLDLQVEDIKADYKDKIWSVKHDNSLSRQERRKEVHELKQQRELAILDAKKDYYKVDTE